MGTLAVVSATAFTIVTPRSFAAATARSVSTTEFASPGLYTMPIFLIFGDSSLSRAMSEATGMRSDVPVMFPFSLGSLASITKPAATGSVTAA